MSAPPIASWQGRRHCDDTLMTPLLSLSPPKWDQIWVKIAKMARGKGKEFQEWIRLWQQHALFLAALAALGLPWSHTYSLTNCFVIVLDSKPSSLPDQIETLQNWWGGCTIAHWGWPGGRHDDGHRGWQGGRHGNEDSLANKITFRIQ